MKRCRRAALVRLVRHMDEELGFQRNEENRRASKIIKERLLLLRDDTGKSLKFKKKIFVFFGQPLKKIIFILLPVLSYLTLYITFIH